MAAVLERHCQSRLSSCDVGLGQKISLFYETAVDHIDMSLKFGASKFIHFYLKGFVKVSTKFWHKFKSF